MEKYNFITIGLIIIFILPVLSGFLRAFTKERVEKGFAAILDNLEFLAGIVLSIYLTKKIFFQNEQGLFKDVYLFIPKTIRNGLEGRDLLTYIIAVPILLMLLLFILRFITNPIYKFILLPLSSGIYQGLRRRKPVWGRITGALSQVPRGFISVFMIGILLNFYTYYYYSPMLEKMMGESSVYQFIYQKTIVPVLHSNWAKQIPVIVNRYFDQRTQEGIESVNEASGKSPVQEWVNDLKGENVRVIEYFNGVTLEEAIQSNEAIDKMTGKIIKSGKNDTEKAYLIYQWISKNIQYDYDKAERISLEPRGISSGSIIAFETRKGICFDFSSLYVTMAKKAGLKVRLVTGLGYSGKVWGDHAWNQVYSSEEKRWIHLDTTFGTMSNYFDKKDFDVDHRKPDIQGEW